MSCEISSGILIPCRTRYKAQRKKRRIRVLVNCCTGCNSSSQLVSDDGEPLYEVTTTSRYEVLRSTCVNLSILIIHMKQALDTHLLDDIRAMHVVVSAQHYQMI